MTKLTTLLLGLALILLGCELPMAAEMNNPLDAKAPAGASTKVLREFSFKPGPGSGTNPATAVNGTIADATVEVTVPDATDLTSLVATFVIAGDSVKVGGVKQVSGETKNSFASPVTYSVLATDGTSKDYVVTVKRTSGGGGGTVSTSIPTAVTVTLSESSSVSWTLASSASRVVSITAPVNPTVIGWYIDGAKVTESAGLTSLNVNSATVPVGLGPHTLMAVVSSGGVWYSATTQFTVN